MAEQPIEEQEPQAAEADAPQAETAAPEKAPAKPKARRSTAKAKAQPESSDETADAVAEAGQEEEAPKKPRASRAKKATAQDSAESAQASAESEGEEQATSEQAPAKPRRRSPSAAAADTPEAPKAAPKPAVAASSGPSVRLVRAQARYVRTSARKARLVCDHLRGKSVDEARAILAFNPRGVARDWSKVLESAIANAENNHELIAEDLVVREAFADEGPTIKRFQPRARGRASSIRKRTSHLTITLAPDRR
jgi:ribosomal protein L22